MKVLKWLDKNIERYLLLGLLIVMVFVMTYQVVMRYVFNSSPTWAEKITQYCFVVSTFFSIGYCIRRGASLRIDMIIANIPKPAAKVLNVITKVILLVFYAFFTYAAFLVIGSYVDAGTRDAALGIPMYVFYTFTFLGFFLTTIRCVQSLVFEFAPEKDPEESSNELDDLPDIEDEIGKAGGSAE